MLALAGYIETLSERDSGFSERIGIHPDHSLKEKGASSPLFVSVPKVIVGGDGDKAVIRLVDEILVAGMRQQKGVVGTVSRR
ncbi:MAG: hypothetical protein K2I92_04180 [Muribaculaceae bacterium]|nr:hypothetical protein [Muribaculaceae bacterium]